jgi:hypothetical protein
VEEKKEKMDDEEPGELEIASEDESDSSKSDDTSSASENEVSVEE